MITKYTAIIIFFLLPISFSISQTSPTVPKTEEPKNILIMFSMNQSLIAYQMILENFKNILREEYPEPYKLSLEYFDLGRFPDSSYQQFLYKEFNHKYRNAEMQK